MIRQGHALSLRRQCVLLYVHRSSLYYQAQGVLDDMAKANMIVEVYQQYPMYGYRRIAAHLRQEGHLVNRKCVARLMNQLGLKAIYPAPKTTVRNHEDNVYPYLLKKVSITKPHQVWQVDITYLRTPHGFMYLTALIDVFSRYVVGWSLSNTLDTASCLMALERAIWDHGVPEIINSDQGSQFTSQAWIQKMQSLGIHISMSGSGRSNDNAHIERLWRTLKYEWMFLYGARTVGDYKKLLPAFISWYNTIRPHQSLGYQPPRESLRKALINPLYGYVDNSNEFSHIPTKPSTTLAEDSLSSS